jgi:hypothetical protein
MRGAARRRVLYGRFLPEERVVYIAVVGSDFVSLVAVRRRFMQNEKSPFTSTFTFQ